jgi:hypothetical protein
LLMNVPPYNSHAVRGNARMLLRKVKRSTAKPLAFQSQVARPQRYCRQAPLDPR